MDYYNIWKRKRITLAAVALVLGVCFIFSLNG